MWMSEGPVCVKRQNLHAEFRTWKNTTDLYVNHPHGLLHSREVFSKVIMYLLLLSTICKGTYSLSNWQVLSLYIVYTIGL